MSKDLALQLGEEETANQESGLSLEVNSLLNADKSAIETLSRHLVHQVSDGTIDPIKAFIHAKKIQELANALVDNIRPYCADHLNIAKGEKLKMFGVQFEQAETGVKYDYKSSGDHAYAEIMTEFEAINKKKLAKEKELKAITAPQDRFDPDTGETYQVKPPTKTGNMGFKSELI